VNGIKIAFVLDDHAGAKKCGFDATHSCAAAGSAAVDSLSK
jgi:hypothetical protein